jgi:hypothetical protein
MAKQYAKPIRCWGCGHPIHNPRPGQMFHSKRCAQRSELLMAYAADQPLAAKKRQRRQHSAA